MTDLTLMTFASDPATVLPSLALLSHRVRVLPMDAASLVKMPENTILFLDARDDLATAKTLCRLIHASGLSTPIVLILTEGGFTVVNSQWGIADVVVASASPAEVEGREVFGHWEMDTVYSGKQTSKKALLVLTERKTRQEIIERMPDRTEESTIKALDRIERRFGALFRKVFKTITVDNGGEFSNVERLEQSAMGSGHAFTIVTRTAVLNGDQTKIKIE